MPTPDPPERMRRVLAAAVLAVVLCSIPLATATPTDDPVTVTLDGTTDGYEAGSTAEFDVVVRNTSGSVGAYDLRLTTSSSLTIQSYEPASPVGPFERIEISGDGRAATLTAANASVESTDGQAVLGTLTVRAEDNGSASITPEVRTLTDANGSQYTDVRVRALSIQIGAESSPVATLPNATGPPASVDDDPLLEDVNGDGTADLFDALDYYNNRDSETIRTNVDAFDFDGDGDAGDLFDALALWNKISG